MGSKDKGTMGTIKNFLKFESKKFEDKHIKKLAKTSLQQFHI
jgi:hypothetical protein